MLCAHRSIALHLSIEHDRFLWWFQFLLAIQSTISWCMKFSWFIQYYFYQQRTIDIRALCNSDECKFFVCFYFFYRVTNSSTIKLRSVYVYEYTYCSSVIGFKYWKKEEKKNIHLVARAPVRLPVNPHALPSIQFQRAESGMGKWNDIKISTLLWLAAKTKLNFFSVEKDFNKLSKSTRQFTNRFRRNMFHVYFKLPCQCSLLEL